jgi:hypothetical protein
MEEGEDGWSDETEEENGNEQKVKKANKMALVELKELLVWIIPSMSLTDHNGYVDPSLLTTVTPTRYRCTAPRQFPRRSSMLALTL